MNNIYLDNNATTRLRPEVLDAMLPFFSQDYGNASSVHQFGRSARSAIDHARAAVASTINAARPDEIIFTGSGSEADNAAVKGIADALKSRGNHIITSAIEHSAVLNTCKFLETRGYNVTYLPVDRTGLVDPAILASAITPQTILISIMLANNEVGTIEPIAEIARIGRERGIVIHTDAVQALGKIPVDVQTLGVDLASFSAHKIHGPKGVGALYIKKGTKITPLMHGGHHEFKKRAGTENVAGIVGFSTACACMRREFDRTTQTMRELSTKLYTDLAGAIADVHLNGHPALRIPNTVNISFQYVEGESIILNLDMEGIAASTGSACTSGSLEPSHVLTAMGIDPVNAQGSIRFSLSHETTADDIQHVVQVLPPLIARLRAMSPLYEGR